MKIKDVVINKYRVICKASRQMGALIKNWKAGVEHTLIQETTNERKAKQLSVAELNNTYAAFGFEFTAVSCYII